MAVVISRLNLEFLNHLDLLPLYGHVAGICSLNRPSMLHSSLRACGSVCVV